MNNNNNNNNNNKINNNINNKYNSNFIDSKEGLGFVNLWLKALLCCQQTKSANSKLYPNQTP